MKFLKYIMTIGIEIHAELLTKTKVFCGCKTNFGSPPNTACCPICLGFPGVLPILNKQSVILTIKSGLLTNCEISHITKFDRKNYFYPDLPKAYQITQNTVPICKNGYITLEKNKKIRIKQIHIEEDSGKLFHLENQIKIDYNRSGIPLIEIVSMPDISSSEEAIEYLKKIRELLKYNFISDCKMHQGSFRCDVNISVRHKSQIELNQKVEIKNLNSFSTIKKAIDFEFNRQCLLLDKNLSIKQETMRFNEKTNETEKMRSKENSADYRYFCEPDILSVFITDNDILTIKESLNHIDLYDDKLKKYVDEFFISKTDAEIILKFKSVSDFFEKSISLTKKTEKICQNAAKLIISHIFRYIPTEKEKETFHLPFNENDFAHLLTLLNENKITMNYCKNCIIEQFENQSISLTEILNNGKHHLIDETVIKQICLTVINDNPMPTNDYKSGKEKALKVLIGQSMKMSKGKADPILIEKALKKILK